MQLRLVVEYEGTAYQGWQLQPGNQTVQAVLERALTTALREPVRVRGAGRTDAGVHACGQVAAVRVAQVPADLDRLLRSLNALTPDDVAVDASGNIFIATLADRAVHWIDPVTGQDRVLVQGLGQPQGLAFDASGNLLVADTGLHQILRIVLRGSP